MEKIRKIVLKRLYTFIQTFGGLIINIFINLYFPELRTLGMFHFIYLNRTNILKCETFWSTHYNKEKGKYVTVYHVQNIVY